MSNFISTMFVSTPSGSHPTYPAKPKPLRPISTFVESQSCMNLRIHMLEDCDRDTESDIRLQGFDSCEEEKRVHSQCARSREMYKSPLQKLGEALQTPQAISDLSAALAASRISTKTTYISKNSVALRSRRQGLGTGGLAAAGIPYDSSHVTSTGLRSPFFSNPRTRAPFKPQKANRGTSSWQLRQYAEATLGSGSLRKAVKLPEGEDKDEWLAVNVVDFYNQINLLYGSITEFCSPQSCPEMKATDEFEYLWQDSENYKRPTKMSAPEYIEHLMAWVQSNVDNEQMFPSRIGVPFPKTFPSLIRNMFKRLYRVYAHIYCHHYPVIIELGLEPHLNTSFKHYVLFIDEHGLANGSKDFWGPLGDLVESMLKND